MNKKIEVGIVGCGFGGDKPKQCFKILGKEMIAYSIELFRSAKSIDDFVVVLNPKEFENGRIGREYGVRVVKSGATRNWSFRNALDYIAKLDDYDWVRTTIKITEALGSYKDHAVDREDYFLVQDHDAYRFKDTYDCFAANHPNGHPAVQLALEANGFNAFHNGPVFTVTHSNNIKFVEMLMKDSESGAHAIQFHQY